jgi:hypothetical protein
MSYPFLDFEVPPLVVGALKSKLQLIRVEEKEMLKSQTTTLSSLSP